MADDRIGFDEQPVERIFEIFHQLPGRREFNGTSIGLAIGKKVVSNHEGAITAHSQVGLGITWSVHLPTE